MGDTRHLAACTNATADSQVTGKSVSLIDIKSEVSVFMIKYVIKEDGSDMLNVSGTRRSLRTCIAVGFLA
jgi:hypothetical protein